jgi:hypothetical protein
MDLFLWNANDKSVIAFLCTGLFYPQTNGDIREVFDSFTCGRRILTLLQGTNNLCSCESVRSTQVLD